MLDQLTFTSYQLVIDGLTPTAEIMKQVVENAIMERTKEGVHYKVQHFVNSAETYYWLCAEYGKPLPLAEKLYDIEKQTSSKNPRKPSQAELRTQLFMMYDFRSSLLYLSNSKKTGFLKELIGTTLGKSVCIKKIYKTAEEFLEITKLVESIRLVAYDDLFSVKTGLFDESKNLFGLGEPTQLQLDLRFNKADKTQSFHDLFLSWDAKLKRLEIANMVCVGYDDDNMEIIFNTDSFANKIKVEVQKNNNGMYLNQFVEESLKRKIGL